MIYIFISFTSTNCANYCYSQHSATKTPASASPFQQTRTSPRKMTYNSATRAYFLCIHLTLSRLDLIFTIRVKHQKNASPAKIRPFRPFLTANKAPKVQNQGQNTPKAPSIYIFTNDTIQLGAKADTFTNQSSHHKKNRPAPERHRSIPSNHHPRNTDYTKTAGSIPHAPQRIQERQIEQ